jgi:hypothetical protein
MIAAEGFNKAFESRIPPGDQVGTAGKRLGVSRGIKGKSEKKTNKKARSEPGFFIFAEIVLKKLSR